MEGHSGGPQANLLLKERLLTEWQPPAQSLMPTRFVTPSLTTVPAYRNAFISPHRGRAGGFSSEKRLFPDILVLEIIAEL